MASDKEFFAEVVSERSAAIMCNWEITASALGRPSHFISEEL
jgi:hypothetical protein